MSDLEILLPSHREIKIKDETIKIAPFKFAQFGLASKFIQAIRSKVGDINGDVDLFNLMATCSEEVRGICVISTGKDSEWVADLELTEAITLVAAIIEVNKDFFIQKVRPLMREMMERISTGETSSQS